MATFGTMKTRLYALLSGHLSMADLGALLNRVHQEEVEAREWHRLKASVVIVSVAPHGEGTIAVSSGSTTVTGTGTSFTSADVGRVLRIGTDDTLFPISAVGGATSLTLGTAWPGSAASGVSYSIFPLTYALPAGTQRVVGVRRDRDLTEVTQEQINAKDPARRSSGTPASEWAPAERSSADVCQIEFWPVNSSAVAYAARYLKGHTDMTASTDTPLVPSSVVENKALHDALMAQYIRSGDDTFLQSANLYFQRYEKELLEAVIADRHAFGLQAQIADALGGATAVDHAYYISHDV